jgi:5-methylthioadenosine/S-adenosylhomocysteine deaminase
VRLLSNLKVLGPRWNLIHAVSVDLDEVDLIAQSRASVIHCPVSNAKTGVGVAPIGELLQRGVRIGLGSDACSNNNTNNILNEAYFAGLIHAAFHHDPRLLSVNTLMDWLTGRGHEIVGTGQLGLLKVGEPADLLLWSLQENAFTPLAYGNFDAALIYNAPDIKPHTILIDGEVVVEEYQFKIFPEREVREAANLSGFKRALAI